MAKLSGFDTCKNRIDGFDRYHYDRETQKTEPVNRMTTCWVRCVNAIHNQNAKSFTNALPQLQDSEAPPRVFTVGASARSKHLNLLPEGGVVTVYDHDELERLRSLVKDMHAPHRKRFGQKIVDAVRKKFRPPPKPPVSVKNKEAEKKIPKRDVG